MRPQADTNLEGRADTRSIAFAAVALAALAAALLAPPDRWFAPNFAFFLGEQALVMLPLMLQSRRPALLGGALVTVTLCLVAFQLWSHWRHETPGWVLFALCMPGAAIGTGLSGILARRWKGRPAGIVAACAAAITLATTLANAAIVSR